MVIIALLFLIATMTPPGALNELNKRRSGTKTSVDINFDETMRVTVQQEHFLANENNKSKLIHMLSQKMIVEGIETGIADGDADTSIVRCGVNKATTICNTAIIGEDVDLLVLLSCLLSCL